MAEQISHNVVNEPQSASGTPLVDAAANHTNTATPGNGTDASLNPNHETTRESNDSATTKLATIPSNDKGPDAGPAAAEPSAGDAARQPAEVPAIGIEGTTVGLKSNANGNDQVLSAAASEDGHAHDTSADPSVASDTEGGRADTLEQGKDGKHVRTNSVKKPVSFSKVSVTKNFMAKTATTAPTAPRIGEKAAPASTAAPSAPKPRLIAKTGASVSALQKARQNAESPSGPDASRVWNKNQAPNPQPAKQFTDEELKQQYGIHLATRLQSDEKAGESKWADIDEDEDDWVPDQVVWVDGTKSSLAPADNTPVPKPAEPAALSTDKHAEKLAEQPTEKPAENNMKLPAPVMKRPNEPAGPPKTILKPGAAAQAKQTGVSSPSPGPDNKAVLKAKSPAPTPVKSPWAALPPVDKVSPINPPVQQQGPPPPMFASQDARSYDNSMPPPPQPAREIAADTFDRSWREGEGERRELFNSSNGRYEPAPEGRRSSMKPEPYARKHALLQRPSQSGIEPAGPSSAFQTRSGSQTDGPPSWGRRRGSSVSHAGMPPPRRVSMNKSPEQFAVSDRRSSNAASHEAIASPASAKNEQQPMFSQQNAWQQQMPPPPAPAAQRGPQQGSQQEDLLKVQDRVMKEKIALARKRRQEEEEKNEAAKQERLKAKLAALEGAGQSRKSRAEAAATPAQDAATTSEVRATDNKDNQKMSESVHQRNVDSEAASAAAPSLESQTEVPAQQRTTATGSKAPSPEKLELPSPLPKPHDTALPTRSASSEQASRLTPRAHLSPQANSRAPFQQHTASSPYRASASAYSSPGERKQQPFGRSPIGSSDAFSPWPSAGSGNVWGSSGIGNGTFESSPGFSSMPLPQQGSALLPPPGMARPTTNNHMSPQLRGQDSRSPSMQQSHIQEQTRAFPPGIEPRPDHFMAQPRMNGTSPSPGLGRQQHVPGPIAPPSRAQPPQNQRPDVGVSAWEQASRTLPAQYASEAAIGPTKQDDREAPGPRNHTFNEVFVQRSSNGKFAKPQHSVHDASGTRRASGQVPAPPSTQTQPSVPVPTASPLNVHKKESGENTVKIPDGSMNPAHGGKPVQQLPIGAPRQPSAMRAVATASIVEPQPPAVSSKEQSPPPPEVATHPAHGGNPKHPHVRLPQAKPKVKLPPAPVVNQQQQPVVMPQRPLQSWGPPGAARPLVQNEAWQARFNGLFNRASIQTETPPSPPKTPPKMHDSSLAVASSSRMAMDDPTATAATVSLPQAHFKKLTTPEGFTIDESPDVMSKEAFEPIFNEELSFGSKPKTAVPRNATYSEVDFDSKYSLLNMSLNSRLQKPVEAHSRHDAPHLFPFPNKGVWINLPGVKTRHNPIFWRRSRQFGSNNRTSDRQNKGRGPVGSTLANAKESNPGLPVSSAPNGTPGNHSRKSSSQQTSTIANAPVPNQNAPVNATGNGASMGNGKRQSNYKGGRQAAPVKST